MRNYQRIMKMIDELQAKSDKLPGRLTVKQANKMLLLSENITAALHAFLFKNKCFF